MKVNVVGLDVGVLLTELDDEFDSYSGVYDHRYGYYDEYQKGYKESDLAEAIKYARECVADGSDMTYAVITNQGQINYNDKFDEDDIESFTYDNEDVIFSVAKICGKIIEDFVGNDEDYVRLYIQEVD